MKNRFIAVFSVLSCQISKTGDQFFVIFVENIEILMSILTRKNAMKKRVLWGGKWQLFGTFQPHVVEKLKEVEKSNFLTLRPPKRLPK